MASFPYSKDDVLKPSLLMQDGILVWGRGTTAQRDAQDPALIINGAVWYNTETDEFEGYKAGSWQQFTLT